MRRLAAYGMLTLFIFLTGCGNNAMTEFGNEGKMPNYTAMLVEPEWIRNGEPLEFEEELWYPQDTVEVLMDPEVILLGYYKGVQFFVEKVDIRPYNRMYTKFSKHKFRLYLKKEMEDDQGEGAF